MARRRRKSGRKKGSGVGGFLLGLFLLALLAAGAVAWLVLTPYGPQTETFVNVAPGSSAVAIGRMLETADVVRSRYAFDWCAGSGTGNCRRGCTCSTIPLR